MRGYFKGNGTNLARIVPYEALKFAAYEECKKVAGTGCWAASVGENVVCVWMCELLHDVHV